MNLVLSKGTGVMVLAKGFTLKNESSIFVSEIRTFFVRFKSSRAEEFF